MNTYEQWIRKEVLDGECAMPSALASRVFNEAIENDPGVNMSKETWRMEALHGQMLHALRLAVKIATLAWIERNPEGAPYKSAVEGIFVSYKDHAVEKLLVEQCQVPPETAILIFDQVLQNDKSVTAGVWARRASSPKMLSQLRAFLVEVVVPWIDQHEPNAPYKAAVQALA